MPGGGGYLHIWATRVCAAQQGINDPVELHIEPKEKEVQSP